MKGKRRKRKSIENTRQKRATHRGKALHAPMHASDIFTCWAIKCMLAGCWESTYIVILAGFDPERSRNNLFINQPPTSQLILDDHSPCKTHQRLQRQYYRPGPELLEVRRRQDFVPHSLTAESTTDGSVLNSKQDYLPPWQGAVISGHSILLATIFITGLDHT